MCRSPETMITPRAPVLADQSVQALALGRQVPPALEAVAFDDALHAADEHAHVGTLAQLRFEPAPLRVAEHGLARFAVGQVALLARRAALIGGFQWRAEPARVQPDDLHAPSAAFDHLRVIEALALMARVLRANAPEAQELVFARLLLRELRAAVVDAVVMVVPDREVRCGVAQGLEVALPGEVGIGLAQLRNLERRVARIDVVAGKDEVAAALLQRCVPDRLRLALVGAGGDADAQAAGAGLVRRDGASAERGRTARAMNSARGAASQCPLGAARRPPEGERAPWERPGGAHANETIG